MPSLERLKKDLIRQVLNDNQYTPERVVLGNFQTPHW
jgi:hypothetical protein